MRNPAHFEIISSGRYFDHDKAAELSRDNAELVGMTGRMLADAFAQGQWRAVDLKRVQIAGRAPVYGFARMDIDGHLPRWGIARADAERTAEGILDLFIEASPSTRDLGSGVVDQFDCGWVSGWKRDGPGRIFRE